MYVLSTSTSCNRGEYFVRISLMPKKEKKKVNYFSPDQAKYRYYSISKKRGRDGKKIDGNISNSMKIRSRKENVQKQSYEYRRSYELRICAMNNFASSCLFYFFFFFNAKNLLTILLLFTDKVKVGLRGARKL